jgi:hypothetical protein
LIVGPPNSKSDSLASEIAKTLQLENINVESYINSLLDDYRNYKNNVLKLKGTEEEANIDPELEKELTAKLPEWLHKILEKIMIGHEIGILQYLEILSYLINRNKVTLKGFVYAIPDGMLWQNLEMVLKGKVNFFIRIESSAKDIIMSSKIELYNRGD